MGVNLRKKQPTIKELADSKTSLENNPFGGGGGFGGSGAGANATGGAYTKADTFKVKEVVDNADGSTTLIYASGDKKQLTAEQERARNADIMAREGLGNAGNVQRAGDKITPEISAMNASERQAVQATTPEAMQASEAVAQTLANMGQVQPDVQAPSTDALDAGKIFGGAVAGAGVGAKFGGGYGAIGGAVLGGLTSFFVSSGSERVQATKTGLKKFKTSTELMTLAGQLASQGANPVQVDMLWNRAYSEALQAQREVDNAGKGLFGTKLAKNLDEAEAIQAWMQQYPIYKMQYEQQKLIRGGQGFNIAFNDAGEVIQA